MKIIFHLITMLGAIAAAIMVYTTITGDLSAMQETAGVAYALSFVLIPYCFAQAAEHISRS